MLSLNDDAVRRKEDDAGFRHGDRTIHIGVLAEERDGL